MDIILYYEYDFPNEIYEYKILIRSAGVAAWRNTSVYQVPDLSHQICGEPLFDATVNITSLYNKSIE